MCKQNILVGRVIKKMSITKNKEGEGLTISSDRDD